MPKVHDKKSTKHKISENSCKTSKNDRESKKIDFKIKDNILDALVFGINPRRFLPYLILDIVSLSCVLLFFFMNAEKFSQYIALMEAGSSMPAEFFSLLSPIIIIFALWLLIKIFVNASVMEQALKPKKGDYKKCWINAKDKYPAFFTVTIIVTLVTGVLGMIEPVFLGNILSVIAALFLLFAASAVIVDKMGVTGSLKKSFDIFRNRWPYVIISWIVILLLNIFILAIFSLPALIVFFDIIAYFFTNGTLEMDMMLYILQNMNYLIISGVIFVLGSSIFEAVNMKITVSFYRILKK